MPGRRGCARNGRRAPAALSRTDGVVSRCGSACLNRPLSLWTAERAAEYHEPAMSSAPAQNDVGVGPLGEQLGIYCISSGSGRLPSSSTEARWRMRGSEEGARIFKCDRYAQAWRMVYVTDGAAAPVRSGGAEVLRAGSVLLLRPDAAARYRTQSEAGFEAHWVAFDGPAVRGGVFCTALDKIAPVAEPGMHADIVELFNRLHDLSHLRLEGYQREMGATIVLMVARLVNYAIAEKRLPQHVSQVEQAKTLIAERARDRLNVEEIAAQVGMSHSTFRRVFRRITGFTPYHYFLRQKVIAGRELLENTALSIRVVAEELGFSDQYHFSRVFRRIAGLSPSKWREERNQLAR